MMSCPDCGTKLLMFNRKHFYCINTTCRVASVYKDVVYYADGESRDLNVFEFV